MKTRHGSIGGSFDASASVWQSITDRLLARGVPSELINELAAKAVGDWRGMLLYGSWARGDAEEHSDLDVLVLDGDTHHQSLRVGRVSLARYDARTFADLSGTLFGFHLARDGVLLHDADGDLASLLAQIEPPKRGSILDRVRSLTSVLDVTDVDRVQYIAGLTKVARYLLRTAMYARALDAGRPCFSIREISMQKEDPTLVAVLSSHESAQPDPSPEVLDDLRSRLAVEVGPLLANPHATLHGLIEGTWLQNRELSNFATLALSTEGEELPYDELPRVTL